MTWPRYIQRYYNFAGQRHESGPGQAYLIWSFKCLTILHKIFFSSNSMICIVYQNQIQPSFIQVLRFLFVYFLWKIKAGKMLQFSIITMIPSYKIKHRETLKYKLFRKNKSNSALCKQSIGNKKKTVPFLESSCFRGLTLNFLRWQKAFLICL